MFRKESEFAAFERVMVEAHLRRSILILSYCGSKLCYRLGRWEGELDGSRQRSFDHAGIRPSAGEHRKRAYGEEKWVRETVTEVRLEQTVRPEGRPRKASQLATQATS